MNIGCEVESGGGGRSESFLNHTLLGRFVTLNLKTVKNVVPTKYMQ